MKAVKEVKRKYYKYVETPFTQPILSSDGVIGGGDFAVFASSELIDRDRYAYKAFNADTGYGFTDSWDPYPQAAPCYIGWYNPNPLKMESLTIRNSTTDSKYSYWVKSGELQYSSDGENWFTEQTFTNTVSSNGAYWTINVDNPVFSKYKRLYITAAGSHNRPIIANIQFNNAIELLPVESTEADYDYYVDVDIYKVVKNNKRKYYKYVYSTWQQPALSSDGVLGEDSFAVYTPHGVYSNCYLWKAFDEDSGYTYWENSTNVLIDNVRHWYVYTYNPIPTNFTQLSISFYYSASRAYVPTYTKIYGSNDRSNWIELTATPITNSASFTTSIEYEGYYKYYWFDFYGGGVSRYITMKNLSMDSATQQATQESTEQDYDYYKDVNTYSVVKQNNIYKAIKSYEKGRYYGN